MLVKPSRARDVKNVAHSAPNRRQVVAIRACYRDRPGVLAAMATHRFHQAALAWALSTGVFIVGNACSPTAAGPPSSRAQAVETRSNQTAAPRPDRSAEFGSLSSRVLQLIQATEYHQALEPGLKALEIAEFRLSRERRPPGQYQKQPRPDLQQHRRLRQSGTIASVRQGDLGGQ